jgi:hypothetical protein
MSPLRLTGKRTQHRARAFRSGSFMYKELTKESACMRGQSHHQRNKNMRPLRTPKHIAGHLALMNSSLRVHTTTTSTSPIGVTTKKMAQLSWSRNLTRSLLVQ